MREMLSSCELYLNMMKHLGHGVMIGAQQSREFGLDL